MLGYLSRSLPRVTTVTGNREADVLNPVLWELVRTAVQAVKSKVAEHVATGKYVPKAQVPTMSRFDSGWPNVSVPLSGTAAAPKYSELFGPTTNPRPYAYDDVPDLATAVEHIVTDPLLLDRFRIITTDTANPPDANELAFIRFKAADFVLSVVDRVHAIGSPNDADAVRAAYQQRERALLATNLEADLVAPLIMTNLDIDQTLEIDSDVLIERLDAPTLLAAARHGYGIEVVPTVVSNAATHAIVIRVSS